MRHFEMFTGRVGQVRDLVELKDGNCVVNFSVAETPRVKKQDGSWGDGVTIWTDVSVFGDEARNLVRSVKPGTFVTVSGVRNAREYVVKDTNDKRIIQQVVAEQVAVAITKFNYIESVGNVNYSKDGRGGGGQSQPQTQQYNQNQGQQNQGQQDQDPFGGSNDPFNGGGDSDPFAGGGDADPFGGGDDDPFKLN